MATRAWAASEIGVRLAVPLADAEMTAADTAGNLKEPIDDALRLLGVEEEDIPGENAPADIPATSLLIAVRWTTLRGVLERIGDRFDIGTATGGNFRLNQVIANVEKLLNLALTDFVNHFGMSPGEMAEAGGIDSLDLNYLGETAREMIG